MKRGNYKKKIIQFDDIFYSLSNMKKGNYKKNSYGLMTFSIILFV
jgi:hypothetical protein